MMESVNFKPHESETETNDTQKMVNEFTKIYKQYYKRVFKYICYRTKEKKFHFSLDYIIDMISPKPSPDELILTK